MKYGELILNERRRAHLTQMQVASEAGVHVNTLVDVERGRLDISEEQLAAILKSITHLSRVETGATA